MTEQIKSPAERQWLSVSEVQRLWDIRSKTSIHFRLGRGELRFKTIRGRRVIFKPSIEGRAERRMASSRVCRVRNVLVEVNVFPRHVYIAACRGRSLHPETLQNGVTP